MGVHRWIIEALGDQAALAQVGADGFLPIEHFGPAMERARLKRFPHVSREEGARLVGAHLARGFLDSEPGQMVDHSIEVLPLDRALASVVMPMGERLRRSAEFDFVASEDGGGRITIKGSLVVSPHTMVGFFQALVDRMPGAHRVELFEQTEGALTLSVTRVPSSTGESR